MSTRYIKKVFGSDIALEQNPEELEYEKSDVNIGREHQKLFNVFDLLNENSENEETEHNDELEIKDEESYDNTSKTKKKRKKYKKKQKQLKNQETEANFEEHKKNNLENLDEIERAVQQINKLLGEPMPSTSANSIDNSEMQAVIKTKEQILMVQHKYLSASKLKRIFDSRTIENTHVKPKTRPHISHLKKMWLVTAHENMPHVSKSGLSMILDETIKQTNVQYFVFDHSTTYRQVQQKFINAVESMNPENIISIINAHPYHVDSLLQCAELYKISEEIAASANFIERALFSLEYAFHPMFNMTTANCRLDYRKQQNRAFFITLFKHLVLIGGLACYRTSLELCKFLLSLDPEGDPLAVILMMDFYAIQSKEYEWFCEFCNLWENSRNLQQLPNIAYSLSLAYFYLGKQESADEMLQNALIMFPGVLIPLLEICNVHTDSRVTGHEFFLYKASSSTSPALEKLQALYIARSFRLWKKAEILPWLEKQVHIVLNRVDAKDDYVKFCRIKRSKRYQGKLPRNILRHLIVSDLKDITVNIQEIQNEEPILSHDPLPPSNSIDIYSNPRSVRRNNLSNSNPFSLFFSSIFNMQGDEAGVNIVNQHNENNGGQNEYD